MGETVWEPFARNSNVNFSISGCANKVANSNFKDLRHSDCLFAVVNSATIDEGVMVAIVVSIALAEHIFLFRDDFS
tara:strand:- start:1411 stop:1638 length:228 start_codon:yes stop_codon:yes gene_type:complete